MQEKSKLVLAYELFLLMLAVLSVSFIWVDDVRFRWIDWGVWGIFVADFVTRFVRADSKWEYVKRNPFDLIAIIPLDAAFRFARIVRLVRAMALASRLIEFRVVLEILRTNGTGRLLAVAFGMIFIASIPVYLIEDSIESYSDALWWSIVTTTTVGYGDLSPSTLPGRLIAIVLMLFGIGMIGMVTGSIATYFLKGKKETNTAASFIQQELDRYEELNEQDMDTLIQLMHKLKQDKQSKSLDS